MKGAKTQPGIIAGLIGGIVGGGIGLIAGFGAATSAFTNDIKYIVMHVVLAMIAAITFYISVIKRKPSFIQKVLIIYAAFGLHVILYSKEIGYLDFNPRLLILFGPYLFVFLFGGGFNSILSLTGNAEATRKILENGIDAYAHIIAA